MSKIKVGINGFGRIGKNVFKIIRERSDIDVIGINDLTDTRTLAQLLKYDSTQGTYKGTVDYRDNYLIVDGEEIKITAERNPINIQWTETPDIVIESTGIFRTRESEKGGYGDHIKNGAKKVILTVPAKDEIDRMIVLGVNSDELLAKDHCVSNASCTTNCLAPIAKVLHENFGIKSGFMNTVHAYTNDQSLLDQPHSDLRRGRAAAVSIIPTTTGAAKAVGKIIPDLSGKLDGISVRVPTPTGSLVDFTAQLEKETTVEEINKLMKEASEGEMKGILEYSEDPLVSVDIIHNPHSSIFDAESTMVNGKMVKILSWYDNEWGYSNRIVDLAIKLGKTL